MENESWISAEMGSGGGGGELRCLIDMREMKTGEARGAEVRGKATGVNGH